ncbi:unnamed protein product [Microthlaspi erraticum]|uniref:Endonuclease/exonuclease/phosphatase domain-containing protein n=1 Tax=Microthlaspi erraticum TaxID=1685480 RepID=A0A6D2JZD2_9BRAS|nr:unnamed protein product [Microthlaspi erraticum]
MMTTATNIVAAATENYYQTLQFEQDEQEEQQLSQVNVLERRMETEPVQQTTQKKRRGRPPKNKRNSPMIGTSLRLRRFTQVQNSPHPRGKPAKGRESNVAESSNRHEANTGDNQNEGRNEQPVVRRLRGIRSSIRPDILFLTETKNHDDVVLQTLQCEEYTSHHLVPPHSPGGGGLALFWKQELEIEILFTCQNFIDTHINAEGESFYTTFVYGEPDQSKRQEVWQNLMTQAQDRTDPWLLTGDFNEIIESAEKKGGTVRPESSFTNFRTFMS